MNMRSQLGRLCTDNVARPTRARISFPYVDGYPA